MRSRYDKDSMKNKLSAKFNTFGSKTMRKGRSVGKKAALSVEKFAKKLIAKVFSSKLVAIICLVIFLISSLIVCAFVATGEDDGYRQNYVGGDDSLYGNEVVPEADGSSTIVELTPANGSCLTYYTLLSRNKSLWQEYVDENGEVSLIYQNDENAVSDYFKNDKDFYVEPNLLYCLNYYIYGNSYVFPESFLNPVAYNPETNELLDIEDDRTGEIKVSSSMRNSLGTESSKKTKGVSDYGLATVLKYKKEVESTHFKGSYVYKDVYDEESGKVIKVTLEEPEYFDYVIENVEHDVLDVAITFAGTIEYHYTPVAVKESGISAGETTMDNELNPVTKVLYDTKTVVVYAVLPQYGSAASDRTKYFTSLIEAELFCENNEGYDLVRDNEGNPITTTRSYNLYMYRGDDTGTYRYFVDNSGCTTSDSGNNYLYEYLNHFSTYTPLMERNYDTFKQMTTTASLNCLNTSGNPSDSGELGSGDNLFEQLYNGDKKEIIERFWDGLIQWGYNEEHAAAVLGNVCRESQFNVSIDDGVDSYGLCQWRLGRYTQLCEFASDYNGTTWDDLTSQIQFACMELDVNGRYPYASPQWDYGDSKWKDVWIESNDIEALAEAVDMGWERSADTEEMIRERQDYALSAYELLSGRDVEYEIEVIRPTLGGDGDVSTDYDETSQATSNMSDEDKKLFSNFYHKVDDVYGGQYKISYFSKPLTDSQIDTLLFKTNSYINNTTMSAETSSTDNQMWDENYLTDFSDTPVQTFASTLDSVEIAEVSELRDLEFLWMLDSEHVTLTSIFGWRNITGGTNDHDGLDIGATLNNVYAPSSGTVVDIKDYGLKIVKIEHGTTKDGKTIATRYLHMDEIYVNIGDTVEKGQVIGISGNTGDNGYTYAYHMHYELFVNGLNYNPMYLYDENNVPCLTPNGELTTVSLDFSYATNYTKDDFYHWVYWKTYGGQICIDIYGNEVSNPY